MSKELSEEIDRAYKARREAVLEPLRQKARRMYKDADSPEDIAEAIFDSIEQMIDDHHPYFYRGL